MSNTTLNHWSDVASLAELWDGAGVEVQADGRVLALFRVGDASLCEGFVEGHEVECPLHQGRFDLRDGTPMCAPAYDALQTWPVRIEGGRVFVALG